MKIYMYFQPPDCSEYTEWSHVIKKPLERVSHAVEHFVEAFNHKFSSKLSSDLIEIYFMGNLKESISMNRKILHLAHEDTCEFLVRLKPNPVEVAPDEPRSDSFSPMLDIADRYKSKGQWRNAKSIWDKILCEIDPLNIRALQGLFELYFQSSQWINAKDLIIKALSSKKLASNLQLRFQLAECHMHLNEEQIAIQFLQTLIQQEELKDHASLMHDAKILLAKALYRSTPIHQEKSIEILREMLLESNETDLDAIAMYSQIAQDRGKPLDALQMILKVLVGRSNDKSIQAICAQYLEASGGFECLKQCLDASSTNSASAYAYLATISKNNGCMGASISCFEEAIQLKPHDTTYALNYVHALEVCTRYSDAYKYIISFLHHNYSLTVGCLSCAEISQILNVYPTLETANGMWSNAELKWEVNHICVDNNTNSFGHLNPSIDLSSDELDLLALWCTLVKILFLQGCLKPFPQLLQLIEPLRHRYHHLLHTTSIRNEHAYYSCIIQLCSIPPLVPYKTNPIYVCGDSHTLATAWRSIDINGKEHTLFPSLVTGLKHWHLRKSNYFYPKIQFWNVIKSIPKGSKVIFLFGEIDCREGILKAVEKCNYETIDIGIENTIEIFLQVLDEIVEKYQIKAFIHPIVPVLNETRCIVQKYNSQFKSKVLKTTFCKWLDFFDDLLTSKEMLNPIYQLDGTHLNPSYLPLLAHAISRVI